MVTEKRAFPRLAQHGQVHVDLLKESNKKNDASIRYEGAMRDISPNGIRLHGKHPLEIGSELELLVELEDNHTQYNVSGRVKWVTETTEHEFVAGIELMQNNSQDFIDWHNSFS